MVGHDIIVIGVSAGGFDVIHKLVRTLPADLPAARIVATKVCTVSSALTALRFIRRKEN